jgi:hypothetical protein
MPLNISLILSFVFTIGAMVVLYVLVLPKKRDGKLGNKFLQMVHDYFHFKQLYLEMIMKFIFTFMTLFCLTYGFFQLFSVDTSRYYTQYYFTQGLSTMLLGPILLRVVYEMTMMVILAVQNIIEINKKMDTLLRDKEEPVCCCQEQEVAE